MIINYLRCTPIGRDTINSRDKNKTTTIIREHVKMSTLDENVNRLTFGPDLPPPPPPTHPKMFIGLRLKPNIEYMCHIYNVEDITKL